jgi:acyl-CoA thioester hydrolase
LTVFVHRLRVRYNECDQQGVVFNGHYLFYYDVALTELWRDRIGPYGEVVASGFDVVVAEATIRYRRAARFDDLLDIAMPVTHLGTTSLVISPEFRVGERVIADGEIRHVFVDPETLRKKPMPDDIRTALSGAA